MVVGWSVGSDDVAGVGEAVLFDVFVEGDVLFDVFDCSFWVVVSVVVEAPELVV